jgi:hypothetical protein
MWTSYQRNPQTHRLERSYIRPSCAWWWDDLEARRKHPIKYGLAVGLAYEQQELTEHEHERLYPDAYYD